MFHIVLVEPEIPPNTGNVIRLCANTGCALHLIEPLGFELDDARLRRAGLDYHEHAAVTRLAPPRPVSHKTALAAHNIYERDLDKTPANHAALTPLQFIERTASVYPDNIALVHGTRRQNWAGGPQLASTVAVRSTGSRTRWRTSNWTVPLAI